MIGILLTATLATPPVTREEQINQFCSYVVGIPYASDNFTDEEWKRFKFCREHLR